METRDACLQRVADARTRARSILSDTPSDPFVSPRMITLLRWLDEIEATLRGGGWRAPAGSVHARIGLYAVRELGEIDGGSLLDDLCPLANMLGGLSEEASEPSRSRPF